MNLAAAASLGAAKLAAIPAALSADTGASTGFDIITVMQGAVDTTKTQMFSVLGIVVPAIVLITAAVVGIKFGISWLRRIKA